MKSPRLSLREQLGLLWWPLGFLFRWYTIRIPLPRLSLDDFRWAWRKYSTRVRCVVCGRRFRGMDRALTWMGRPGEDGCTELEVVGQCLLCRKD